MLLWLGFLVCTAIIIYAGSRLSLYGDVISEKSGLGRTWIGLVLMASVTSLPETVNAIGSVTFAGVPDIAAGDLIGSCVFNLLILAFLDALYQPTPICSSAQIGHTISGSFGILQLGLVITAILHIQHIPGIGWIGFYSIIFIVIYLLAMKLTFQYEKRIIENRNTDKFEAAYAHISLKRALWLFIVNAILVVVAAVFLPKIGEGIAEMTGLGQTFVGNILIALSTSLPEVVVAIAAVRIRAVDLAIGNLMGSNVFNIAILGLADILYLKGPMLEIVSRNHIISAISAIMMTAIVIIGITYRAERKKLFLSWDAILIVLIYILNIIFIYLAK